MLPSFAPLRIASASPSPRAVGGLAAVGFRAWFVASDELAIRWDLTDRRLLGPGTRAVRLAEIKAINTLGSAVQVVTLSGEKHLLKYQKDRNATRARIDTRNPMRVQRAWEVLRATGRPLARWQDDTPPPLLPLADATALLFDVERDWLNARIARRFDQMLDHGALDEARANLAHWDPARLSSKAIGAPELIAHLRGELTLEQARVTATIATRQFAKRQRTWFRSKMRNWQPVTP